MGMPSGTPSCTGNVPQLLWNTLSIIQEESGTGIGVTQHTIREDRAFRLPMRDAGTSPAVGIAGKGGMPGLPSAPPHSPTNRQDAASSGDATPPVRVGMAVDEEYHKVGAANDLLFVQGVNGSLSVSDFHVFFNRKERIKGGPPKASSTLSTMNKSVHTYINGELQPQLYLRVKDDGFCTFPDGSLQPPPDSLVGGVNLVTGVNNIRFEIRYLRDPRVLVTQCFAFLWPVNTPMIVVDIDGTITRSDVPGLLMTLTPGIMSNHTHAGICKLLSRIAEEEGVQVVYLTSRPIVLAPKTRTFLTSLEQEGRKLPLGPLQCCLEKVSGVLWRELVSKNMHDYKIAALLEFARLFREAGRHFGQGVFAAGIGNKLHDAVAYKAAGIPDDFIFLIDSDSKLRVWDGDSSKLGGGSEGKAISPHGAEAEPSPVTSRRKRLGDKSKQWLGGGNSSSSSSSSGGSSRSNAGKDGPVGKAGDDRRRQGEEGTSNDNDEEEIISFSPAADAGAAGAAGADHSSASSLAGKSGGKSPAPLPALPEASEASGDGKLEASTAAQTTPTPTAAVAQPAAPLAGSLGYQSYGDDNFFPRLRASLDLVAWEASKAIEAGVSTMGEVAHTAQGGAPGGSAWRLTRPLQPRPEDEVSREQAESRLAERVHEMAAEASASTLDCNDKDAVCAAGGSEDGGDVERSEGVKAVDAGGVRNTSEEGENNSE